MIYNIYKPKDLSSFSIVKKVKNITKEKVGHSGTLDPFADGVLVLGVGKSTKKLSNIIQFDKTYEGIIKLGEKTDSMDLTGNIVEEKVIKPYFLKSISLVKISLMVFKTCCDTLSDLEKGLLFNCLLMFS